MSSSGRQPRATWCALVFLTTFCSTSLSFLFFSFPTPCTVPPSRFPSQASPGAPAVRAATKQASALSFPYLNADLLLLLLLPQPTARPLLPLPLHSPALRLRRRRHPTFVLRTLLLFLLLPFLLRPRQPRSRPRRRPCCSLISLPFFSPLIYFSLLPTTFFP